MTTWEATAHDIPGGRKYRVLEDDANLSFRQLFELLRSYDEFADWYSELLAAFQGQAFYWELPPLTAATIEDEAEFVDFSNSSVFLTEEHVIF